MSDTTSRPLRSLAAGLLVPALVASVALNVALAARAGAQRELINSIRVQYNPLRNQTVPPFAATTVTGALVKVDYAEVRVPTVVYFFRPWCSWCRRNHPAFEALVSQSRERYRVLAVSLDREGLDGYLRENPMTATVLTDVDAATVDAYDAGGTPQMLVVSPEATVLENWQGAFTGDQRRQIELRLGVELPAVEAAPDDVH